MKIIKKLFAYIITIPPFIIWLLFCFFISLLGALFNQRKIKIDLVKVKKRDTICSVLYNKKLLTNEEYEFETCEVASWYDELTFRGYLFVLAPVIFLLKYFSFADGFVLYVVKKWIKIHRYQKKYSGKPKTFFSSFISLCVLLANFVGQVLYRIK